MTKALVLSGGGPVGIAWESGIAAGLAGNGVQLSDADFIVGTSAGSAVGAQIAQGQDMSEVVERYRSARPAAPATTTRPTAGATGEQMQEMMTAFMEMFASDAPPEERRAKIGAFALQAQTIDEDAFVANFRHQADAPWPARYACTAVDAETGEFVVWNGSSGAELARAVASSCAVPGIFPPITINGRRYIDGGMRSGTNADLAAGHDRVLVLSLMDPKKMAGPMAALAAGFAEEVTAIEAAGGTVEVVYPDADASAAMGVNLMDPSVSPAAAEAGMRQGKALADVLKDFWV